MKYMFARLPGVPEIVIVVWFLMNHHQGLTIPLSEGVSS
jgi:hypothetical protein